MVKRCCAEIATGLSQTPARAIMKSRRLTAIRICRPRQSSFGRRRSSRTTSIRGAIGPPYPFSHFPDPRRLPRTVENAFLAPIGADIEREVPIRRRKPVRLLTAARRFRAGIQRQRTVGVALQVLVLGAERIALEVVGVEQVLVIVKCQ